MNDQILIIVFAPLLAAIVGGLGNRSLGNTVVKSLTTGALFLSCALSWPIFLGFLNGTVEASVVPVLQWVRSGDLAFDWALRVDTLTAVMLVVITTDAVVDPAALPGQLATATGISFDRVDSDGCMSTNDTVLLLSSGASGVVPEPDAFAETVRAVCADLARQLIGDAEGASKDIRIEVTGAADAAAVFGPVIDAWVALDADALPAGDLIAIDTDSRYLPVEQAVDAVGLATRSAVAMISATSPSE